MARGLSQKDFAAIVNIAPNTLSQYETGKREPDLKTLSKLADYFGVSVDYLLGRGERQPDNSKMPAPKNESGQKQDELETRFMNAVQRLPLVQKVALLELVEAAVRNDSAGTPQTPPRLSVVQPLTAGTSAATVHSNP